MKWLNFHIQSLKKKNLPQINLRYWMKKIRIKKKTRNCCFNVFWSERFVVFIDTIYLHSYWCDSVCCVGSILCWYPWQHRKDCPVTIILSKMCVLDFVVCCTSKPSCYLKKATALFKIVMVFWLSLIFFILNYTL